MENPIVLQAEKTADTGSGNHVPVVEKSKTGSSLKSEQFPPMEENHSIERVEARSGDTVYIHGFKTR